MPLQEILGFKSTMGICELIDILLVLKIAQ